MHMNAESKWVRVPALDSLRGIAAIAVMLFHFEYNFVPQVKLINLIPGLGRAYLAVDLFFLLSGFIMAYVYGEALASNPKAYWSRFAVARFARLYPLFAITTSAMVLITVLFPQTPITTSLSAKSLALQPFMLQVWASSLNWNYPSWSISTEIAAYTCFVFLARPLLDGSYPRLVAVVCLGILACLSFSNFGSLDYYRGGPALIRTIAGFCLGVLIYRLYLTRSQHSRIWMILGTILFLGVGRVTRQDVFIVCAFASFITYIVSSRDAAVQLLDVKPLRALGQWSYSIYLWHAPVYFAFTAMLIALGITPSSLSRESAVLLVIAVSIFVIILGAVLHYWFEQPCRKKIIAIYDRIDGSGPWRRRAKSA